MRGRFAVVVSASCFVLSACAGLLDIQDPSDPTGDGGLEAQVDSANVPSDGSLRDIVTMNDAGSDVVSPPPDLGIFCGDAGFCNEATEVCSLTYCMGPAGTQKCVMKGLMTSCAQVKCTDTFDCQPNALCCTNYNGAGGYVPLDTITGASCVVTTACPAIQMCNPSHLDCPDGSTCLSTKPAGYFSCQ